MHLLCSLAVFLGVFNNALAADLGQALQPVMRPDGKPALGVATMTGDDPDGARYLFNFTPAVSIQDSMKSVKINYFMKSTLTLAKSWNELPSLPLATIQLKESNPKIVKALIAAQADTENDVFFVLSENNGETISYNISVSDLCRRFPLAFRDLTHGKACR